MADLLPEEKRKRVFADVVATQDQGKSVLDARAYVAKQHEVTPDVVKEIEREGIEASWPPLSD